MCVAQTENGVACHLQGLLALTRAPWRTPHLTLSLLVLLATSQEGFGEGLQQIRASPQGLSSLPVSSVPSLARLALSRQGEWGEVCSFQSWTPGDFQKEKNLI